MPIRRLPTDEEIAARAHQIYEQRGRADGSALDDWLAAEAELGAAEAPAQPDDPRSSDWDADGPAKRTPSAKPKRR